MKIEAIHQFHDKEYAEDWAEKFSPTPERMRLFELITDNIKTRYNSNVHIVELGIGPGYLAAHLLDSLPGITYEGLDFSKAMLEVARDRLLNHINYLRLSQVDLTDKGWGRTVRNQPDVIVSTWALHDLMDKDHIASVYTASAQLLLNGGLLINGDFIKPSISEIDYEAGRIKPEEHLELMRIAGFRDYTCIGHFEENVSEPTTANNYSCFLAIK